MTRFEGADLTNGTCFFVSEGKQTFLLTNWHIVSGRSPTTRRTIHPSSGIPRHMRVRFPYHERADNGSIKRSFREKLIPLYDDENNALWREHPIHREKVDIAAIDIEELEETAVLTAESDKHQLDKLRLYPSLDVYVLGFPGGLLGTASTPIWKRGTIATEPDFDHDGLPMFLIDTATREGMSGSPVYAQEVGTWLPADAKADDMRVFGKGRMFVGIYSGRIHAEDEFGAQLGKVWKRSAINEVLRDGVRGQNSFEMGLHPERI